MRLTHLLTVPAAAGAIILLGMSSASAGEISGTRQPARRRGPGRAHANSICAFSGLQDGDGAGFPGPGGAPPAELGTRQGGVRRDPGRAQGVRVPARRTSCNGHSGFLAGGGGDGALTGPAAPNQRAASPRCSPRAVVGGYRVGRAQWWA